MTLWFSATAVTPALSRELQLSAAEASWLTMAVQGGFVARHAARRVRQHRRPRAGPAPRVRRRRGWRAGQRRGARSRPAPGRDRAALPHRRGAGCRLSAGDEDGRELVRVAPRPGARAADWRADARQGRAVPDDHGVRRSLAAAAARGVRTGVARRRCWSLPSRAMAPIWRRRVASILTPSAACSESAACGSRLPAIWATCGSSTRCGRGSACSPPPASRRPGWGPRPSMAGSAAAFLAIGSGAAGCALAG